VLKKRSVACEKKRACDAAEKRHFIIARNFSCNKANLNEITHEYLDSKQHLYLQYHVAATDMKALRKKQTTLQAVAYLGFPPPGNKLSLGTPNQPVRGGIK